MDTFYTILFVIYIIAGYWSVKQTIDANKDFIVYKPGSLFIRRLIIGSMFGWILIPVAIIKKLVSGE